MNEKTKKALADYREAVKAGKVCRRSKSERLAILKDKYNKLSEKLQILKQKIVRLDTQINRDKIKELTGKFTMDELEMLLKNR